MDTPAAQDALLFIPDISGFTQFVNETEITHSQHIIEELLEEIIEANQLGLILAEIEGDAILFYRPGAPPTTAELLAQVQNMFVRFHAHLRKYDTHRICQCGACCSTHALSLKFFCHYGEVTINKVQDTSKPFGRNVILTHRLMKNSIDGSAYALMTEDLIRVCENWVNISEVSWSPPVPGEETYDAGSVKYMHIPLDALQAHVPVPTAADYSIPGATDLILEGEKVIEAPVDLVFDVVSDFDFRHRWFIGLKGVENSNKIPQTGMSHRCIIKQNDSDPSFIVHGFNVQKDLISFVESNHKQGISGVFFLRRLGRGLTKVEAKYFMKPNALKKFIFNLFIRKKLEGLIHAQFENLNAYCRQLVEENKGHLNHIELKLEDAA